MNITKWIKELPRLGLPMPILSFPATSLCGVSVYEITHSAKVQTMCMTQLSKRVKAAAALSMMDLSVEAEAFGSTVKTSENEIPTVVGALLSDIDDARALKVPCVGAGRTGLYVKAAADAKAKITDRPVFAGMIGPFSLAGRLMDVSEIMVNCIAEPEFVYAALASAAEFLINYARAYKAAGVDGIVMAEPLSGLLSPALEAEFASPYDKKIIDAVQDDSFAVIYHNCGPNTPLMTESIYGTGASAFHFGDAVSLPEMLRKMPSDKPVCGNISPSKYFLNGTPDTVYAATRELMESCRGYDNFVLSSGCDIPLRTPWGNIDAFFEAGKKFAN